MGGEGGITSASDEDTNKTGTAILKDNHAGWSCLLQAYQCVSTQHRIFHEPSIKVLLSFYFFSFFLISLITLYNIQTHC